MQATWRSTFTELLTSEGPAQPAKNPKNTCQLQSTQGSAKISHEGAMPRVITRAPSESLLYCMQACSPGHQKPTTKPL